METLQTNFAELLMNTSKRGRERGQNGRLMIVGKRRKMWRGHFFVYEWVVDGYEVRKHKALILGARNEMTRMEAQNALRAAIAEQSQAPKALKGEFTFGQYWRERYLPMHQAVWSESSRATQIGNITRYCVDLLDATPLQDIERFQLQMIANDLAKRFSKSVVEKFVTWTRAILEEAVDEDFLHKNPARKLRLPETKPVNKRFLTLNEIAVVLGKLPFRESFIFRVSLVLGLRPAELLALRWNDIQGHGLRLDESTIDGKLYPRLKTAGSRGYVALPASLLHDFEEWRGQQKPKDENAFVFPNSKGRVFHLDTYRARVLRPQLKEIAKEGIAGVDFRACRRTCATHLSQHGSIKEVQAHLRHSRAITTLEVYIQEIPREVRAAVEALDSSPSHFA